LGSFIDTHPNLGHVTGSGIGFVRATGGPISGEGDVMVGERGPEILHLGAGVTGHVTPNSALRSTLGASPGGGTVVVSVGQVVVQGSDDVKKTALAVRDVLLNMARGQGKTTLFGANA
jgi:hypothetical protein